MIIRNANLLFWFLRNGYKIGFDVFEDRIKSNKDSLVFPLKSKASIDNSGIDMNCIESIIEHIIKKLNISPNEYDV